MMICNPISNTVRALIIGGWIAALLMWERRRALRRVVDSKIERDVRNFTVAVLAGAAMQFLELPVALGLAKHAEGERWGLVQQLQLPEFGRTILAIIARLHTVPVACAY